MIAARAIGGPHALNGIRLDTSGHVIAGVAVLQFLVFINVILLVFNLVPGYPLDGGRIARAIAWWRTGDRERATRVPARLGRAFGFLLMAGGVVLLVAGDVVGGVWSIAIGLMLSQSARGGRAEPGSPSSSATRGYPT